MPSLYVTLADALLRAKERSGATAIDDIYLTELLEMSAGIDPEFRTHFRPFFVSAKFLEQNLSKQALKEADGAKFTGLAKPIESLLQLQRAYDQAHDLVIPTAFQALPSDCDPCDKASAISGGIAQRYSRQAIAFTTYP